MKQALGARKSFFYIASSILVGPAIAIGGFALLSGNGDQCAGVYRDDPALRTSEYLLMNMVHFAGGGIMLIVGVYVLAFLWRRGRRLNPVVLALLSFGILVVMLGYSSLIFAGLAWRPGGVDCGL